MSRWRIVAASVHVAAHVEHLLPDESTSCGPLATQANMPRAGECGPGVEVCCMACGDAVEVPPEVVRKVRASEQAWDRQVKADETRGADLARLRAAGVDVSKLPPPASPRRSRRVVQHNLFANVRAALPAGETCTDEEARDFLAARGAKLGEEPPW